jgi:hypothetical protein
MNNTLKTKLIETAKQLQPLMNQLPQNNGKDNYITYVNILSNIPDKTMRKFTALALMECDNTNLDGVLIALDIVDGYKS